MWLVVAMQVIIEKAYQGNKDHIRAALDLFVDFMAIFVRSPLLNFIIVRGCSLTDRGCTASTGRATGTSACPSRIFLCWKVLG